MDNTYLPLEKFGIKDLSSLESIKLNEYKTLKGIGCVYIFYFKDEPIYIGKTVSLRNRIEQHLKGDRLKPYLEEACYIKIFWAKFFGREILEIERILIRHFKPILNIQGNGKQKTKKALPY